MAMASSSKHIRRRSRDNAFAWLARIGYAARGVVFVLIGIFSALAALGKHRPLGTTGVLHEIFVRPMGDVLLGIIAAGLFCFACWRFLDAVFDSSHFGNHMEGIIRRVGMGGSGIFYLLLAGVAVRTMLGLPARDDQAARDWTAWLLSYRWGQWVTVLIGIGVVASAIGQVSKPARLEFRRQIELKAKSRAGLVVFGIVGFIGRAVVLVLIGIFLVIAAVQFNSGEAAGFAGALRAVQGQPYGSVLLVLVGLGLLVFGLFQFSEAAWRRIDVPGVRRAVAMAKKKAS
jgi:hypothetical protein